MERTKVEASRQIFHLFAGLTVVLIAWFIKRDVALITFSSLFVLGIVFSLISLKRKIPGISFVIEKIGREKDLKFPGRGFVFFMMGAFLTLLLFPKDIALASLIILAFGDSASTLAGVFVKEYRYRQKPFSQYKTPMGTLFGAVLAFLAALIFVDPPYALVGAVFGMFSEALHIRVLNFDVDDNFTVPVVAGAAMYLLRVWLHF